jgi:hypothetical protein
MYLHLNEGGLCCNGSSNMVLFVLFHFISFHSFSFMIYKVVHITMNNYNIVCFVIMMNEQLITNYILHLHLQLHLQLHLYLFIFNLLDRN